MSLLKAPPPYRYRFNPNIPNSVAVSVVLFFFKQVCRKCLNFLASSWDIKLRSDLYTNPDSAQNRIRIRNLAFMVEHRICCKYVTRQNSLKLEIELENVGQRNGFHLTVFLPPKDFLPSQQNLVLIPHAQEVLSSILWTFDKTSWTYRALKNPNERVQDNKFNIVVINSIPNILNNLCLLSIPYDMVK